MSHLSANGEGWLIHSICILVLSYKFFDGGVSILLSINFSISRLTLTGVETGFSTILSGNFSNTSIKSSCCMWQVIDLRTECAVTLLVSSASFVVFNTALAICHIMTGGGQHFQLLYIFGLGINLQSRNYQETIGYARFPDMKIYDTVHLET